MKRRDRYAVDCFHCPVCGYPSLSVRGTRIHHTLSHGAGGFAERNWAIFEMATHSAYSIQTIAEVFSLSEASILRVVHRGLSWPGIFDLSPATQEKPHVR